MNISQQKAILAHLRNGKTLTPLQALRFYGCFRLSARIFDLKQQGYNIVMDMVQRSNKRVARYSMVK